MSRDETVEIACEIRYESADALLIFDGQSEHWIPKSQIISHDSEEDDWSDLTEIEIPRWLAYEKGLI